MNIFKSLIAILTLTTFSTNGVSREVEDSYSSFLAVRYTVICLDGVEYYKSSTTVKALAVKYDKRTGKPSLCHK